jgi:hypothetical protein
MTEHAPVPFTSGLRILLSDEKRDAWVKFREVVPVHSGAQSPRRANAEITAQP